VVLGVPGRLFRRRLVGHERNIEPGSIVSSISEWLPYTSRVDEQWSDPEFLGAVFAQTEIVRKPLTGIITGYHVLPYILVGPEHERAEPCRRGLRGRIKVSPRLILTAGSDGPHVR